MKHLSQVIISTRSGKRCFSPEHLPACESSPNGSASFPGGCSFSSSPEARHCLAKRGDCDARRFAYSQAYSGKALKREP
jgi:hypothetical protein